LLNAPSTPHLVLKSLHQYADSSEDVLAIMNEPRRRRDFDVTIEGYGSGVLAVLVR
jgi:hypothetical protein